MRFLSKAQDGGPSSTVTGYWLIELKSLFSVVLLRFDDGSRDEYHDHAFDSINWVLTGRVTEQRIDVSLSPELVKTCSRVRQFTRSLRPILTRRSTFHRVVSDGTTWVLSFRGPWSRTWREHDLRTGQTTTLTHGRIVQ